MGKVQLEFLPSLAETLGVEQTIEEATSERQNDGVGSIIELLNRLCLKYRRFNRTVFDISTQELTGEVVIFLNGHSLDVVNGLKTRLSDGDTLTFVPFIEGG